MGIIFTELCIFVFCRFVEIQQAYEKLSQIKKTRKVRNSQSDMEDREEDY